MDHINDDSMRISLLVRMSVATILLNIIFFGRKIFKSLASLCPINFVFHVCALTADAWIFQSGFLFHLFNASLSAFINFTQYSTHTSRMNLGLLLKQLSSKLDNIALLFVETHIRTCLAVILYYVSVIIFDLFCLPSLNKINLSSLKPLLFPLIEVPALFYSKKRYLIKALHTLVNVFSSFIKFYLLLFLFFYGRLNKMDSPFQIHLTNLNVSSRELNSNSAYCENRVECSHSTACITGLTFGYAHAQKLNQNCPSLQRNNCLGASRPGPLPFSAWELTW